MKHSFAEGSPEDLFRSLDHIHRTTMDAMMARAGLSDLGQPKLLTILCFAPDGIVDSQRELARRLHVSPATVTMSLNSMERGGYIRRLPDENDLRRKRIAITEKGRKAVERLDTVLDRLDHGMYRGFSPEERTQISAYFVRMIRNLQQIPASDPVAASDKEEP